MQRLDVNLEFTCIWQVSGENNIGFDEWIEMDIDYIKTRNLWLDINLILKTVEFYLVMIMHYNKKEVKIKNIFNII